MFLRCLVLVIATVAVCAAVLSMRQKRYDMANEMAHLHRQIDDSRRAMWDQQVKIANEVEPGKLEDAIARAGLKLEPLVSTQTPSQPHPGTGAGTGTGTGNRLSTRTRTH